MHDTGPRGDGRRLFLACHDLLAGHPVSAPEGLRAAAEEILDQFDYRSTPADHANQRALLRFAADMGGVFRLRSPHAPSLHCFGGLVARPGVDSPDDAPPMSVTGSGLTVREAFEACVGEAVEYASLFGSDLPGMRSAAVRDIGFAPDDALLAEVVEHHFRSTSGLDRPAAWLPATRLDDGAPATVPACFVLRSAAKEPAETGCAIGIAAHRSFGEATAAALHEAIERDAVAVWWVGGRRARPIGLETLIRADAPRLLATLRGSATHRSTALFDLTTDHGVPVVGAFSFDADGGRFAGGYACRADTGAAIRSAVVELAQNELGYDVLAFKKRQFGEAAVSDADRRLARRTEALPPDCAGLIDGFLGPLSLSSPGKGTAPTGTDPVQALRRAGIRAYAVDLSRPSFGIPVAAVLVPGLQRYPSPVATASLEAFNAAGTQHVTSARTVDLF